MLVPNTKIVVPVEEGYFTEDYIPFDVCVVGYLAAAGIESALIIHTQGSGTDLEEAPDSSRVIQWLPIAGLAIVATVLAIKFGPMLSGASKVGALETGGIGDKIPESKGGFFS